MFVETRNDDLCHILHESCCLADAPAIIEVYWQWLFMAWWSDAMDRHSLGLFPGSLSRLPQQIRIFMAVWRKRVFNISCIKENHFLIKCTGKEEMDSIIRWDPWNFYCDLVALTKFIPTLSLHDYQFDKLEIWVRVFNIPVGSWERYLVIRSDVRLPSTLEEVVVISKFEWN
ncbi:hypothetical protein V6N13_079937 [Hibiscus sabdariffa]